MMSKIFLPCGNPYITSYITSFYIFSLSRTVFEILDFKVLMIWPWPLTFRGHLRSKIVSSFESPYMTSYLTSIDTFYLVRFSRYSTSKFSEFDLDLWPLKVTEGRKYSLHSKVHTWLPIEFPLTFSLYIVPFSRYSTSKFSWFDLDLWPLEVTRGRK